MKQSSFTIFYFSIGIVFIILERYFNSFYPELIAKALIIPSLMVYYHASVRGNYSALHRLVMAGLFFSWLGDILLQMGNGKLDSGISPESFFMFGLIAFLFTHTFYLLAFSLPKGKNTIFSTRIYQMVLVIAYGLLLMWLLYNKLLTSEFNFRAPVIIFTAVILAMLVAAFNRYGKVNGVSYMLVAIGAILLVASASMIAISKFLEKFDFARILIMTSYIAAQYLIVLGCIKQDFPEEE